VSQARHLQDCQVTIVGLGLMGSSLAAALRGQCRTIVGVTRRPETAETARAQGLVDEATTSLAAGLRQADIAILATPVRVILDQLPAIGPLLPPGCLLMDLGSTKAQVVTAMSRLPEHVQPLGGHPMCGKEISGLEAADPDLYRGCTFILSPLPRTSREALDLARELVKATGAHALVLEPERQDYLVATLSHLPYLLACSLVATADTTTSADPAAWKIVAGGFRDTTRVSGSDVTMMLDILLTNRDEILASCSAFQAQFGRLVRLLEQGDEAALRQALTTLRDKRREMFP
jgi:prephenate dehydrogenase